MGKFNWHSSIGLCIVLTCCSIASAGNIEIVVNPTLYASGEITASLNQYIADVQAQGHTPILTTSAFADAAALRSHLANRYNTDGLDGAVFIGDMPNARYEATDISTFPCDLYYMDLDGSWTDTDSDSYLDTHEAGTGDELPEIFLGRIAAGCGVSLYPGSTEASLLNQYFQKNHAYRAGQLSVAPDGLAYVDDDWAYSANNWARDMSLALTGTVTVINDPNTTADDHYEAQLATGEYENLWIGVHSNGSYHNFEQPFEGDWNAGDDWRWTTSQEVAAMNPKVLFYNLWACFAGDYSKNGFLNAAYIFGNDYGLLACGSSKSGGMLWCTDIYFGSLGAGKTFGQAFYDWWLAEADCYSVPGEYEAFNVGWHYGQTLMGDPLLVTQAYIPEPATLMLLTSGSACLTLRRKRA